MTKILIAAIAIATIMASCGNANSKKNDFVAKSDTTLVLAFFKLGQYRADTVQKVRYDVFKSVAVDTASGHGNYKWVKDSFYRIAIITDTVSKVAKWYNFSPEYFQEVKLLPLAN